MSVVGEWSLQDCDIWHPAALQMFTDVTCKCIVWVQHEPHLLAAIMSHLCVCAFAGKWEATLHASRS